MCKWIARLTGCNEREVATAGRSVPLSRKPPQPSGKEGEEEAVKKFCADYCIEHGIEWRDGATLKNTDDEMIQNVQLLIVSAWTR